MLHDVINKDTFKLEKHTEGFETAQLHNWNSALLFGFKEDFPSKNLKVLYKQEGTKSYTQTAYAHFRDYKEVQRV